MKNKIDRIKSRIDNLQKYFLEYSLNAEEVIFIEKELNSFKEELLNIEDDGEKTTD